MMQAAAEWSDGTEQFDDTTVVVVDVAVETYPRHSVTDHARRASRPARPSNCADIQRASVSLRAGEPHSHSSSISWPLDCKLPWQRFDKETTLTKRTAS